MKRAIFISMFGVATAACGGSDDGGDPVCVAEAGTVTTYVADRLTIPKDKGEADSLAIDIDGNGTADNSLGKIIPLIAEIGGGDFDISTSVNDAVSEGNPILLMGLKSESFSTASGVGLQVLLGQTDGTEPCQENGNGAACDPDPENPNDTCQCGQHLKGDAMFKVAATSPSDAILSGNIIGGKFASRPGKVTLTLQISEGSTLTATLQRAHIEIAQLSDSNLTSGKLVGGISTTDVNNQLLPAIAGFINQSLVDDCDAVANGGDGNGTIEISEIMTCCNNNPMGETTYCEDKMNSPGSGPDGIPNNADDVSCGGYDLICSLNKDDSDTPNAVAITALDLQKNSLVVGALTPDVDLSGDGEKDGVSLGLGFSAVKGTFPAPDFSVDGELYCSAE